MAVSADLIALAPGLELLQNQTARQALPTPQSGPDHNERMERPMAKRPLPSPEVLRQLLRYEPDTGKLFWKERGPEWFAGGFKGTPKSRADKWNARYAGQEAFTTPLDKSGRRTGRVLDRQFLAHRVIWAIHAGEWPHLIDHASGDPSDNRIENLRSATKQQNSFNRCANKSAPYSRFKGVFRDIRDGVWYARGVIDGVNHHLGRFKDEAEAARAYDDWAIKHHAAFTRLNFPDDGVVNGNVC